MTSGELPFVTLLRAIGRGQGEKLSICTDAISERHPDGRFRSRVLSAKDAVAQIERSEVARAGNTWYGVARLRTDFEVGSGRGWAKDVAGVRALYADLDVKPGGLDSVEAATAVIDDISSTLGVPPVAVVSTGGGLQPYWRLVRDSRSDFEPGGDVWLAAVASFRRFGRLVATVAENRGGRVDAVYDLSRVLRVPGTMNRKYSPPVLATVSVEQTVDAARCQISLDDLDRVLDDAGITEVDEDRAVVGTVVRPVEEWDWAPEGVVCQYVRAMVDAWANDDGSAAGGRHPWLVAQATRLAAVHRAGLVGPEQYAAAQNRLLSRFQELLDTQDPRRTANPGEAAGALGWGQMMAASKSEEALASEFGGHRHEIDGGVFGEGAACLRGMRAEVMPARTVEKASGSAEQPPADTAESESASVDGDRDGYQMQPAEMFTDARMAELAVRDVLKGRYMWVSGLGWHHWDGRRWTLCPDQVVIEAVRAWAVEQLKVMVVRKRRGPGDAYYDGWQKMLGVPKIKNVLAFCTGMVLVEVDALDGNPDLLNTPGGVVDLRDGSVSGHDPGLMMTKITSGNYVPGFVHADWEKALEALGIPDGGDTVEWFQTRVGQGITGHRSPDGVNVVLQGGGQNGKGVLVSDGLVPALGDYAELASHKLILGENEHSTEQASLQGKRFLVAEELTEGRSLNVGAIKRISDVSTITARHVYQRNMTFRATHTLFATTNYIPVVNETDWGTWRRLALLMFPYTFVASRGELVRESDRLGDPRLKGRIEGNETGQHDAAVTWAVEGAIRWYRRGAEALAAPAWVVERTEAWRGNADRISAFWGEHIIASEDECVLANELFESFNAWLTENGHKTWSREMFESRFGSHQITLKHGLEKRRMMNPKGISRHVVSDDWKPTKIDAKAQHMVWLGVRFATSEDRRPLYAVGLLPKIP